MSLPHTGVSAVICITTKVAILLYALRKQRPCTSTRFLVTTQTTTYLQAAVGPRTQTGPSEAAGNVHINMASGGRAGHSDENDGSSFTAHGHQQGLRQQCRSQTSTWPLVLKQTKDINPDPGCSKITDPEMTLRSSMNPDITMASDGSVGHPHQYGLQRQHCLLTSKWVQAAAQTTEIYIASGAKTHQGY